MIVWQTASRVKRHARHLAGRVREVAFTPGGRHLATMNGIGPTYLLRSASLLSSGGEGKNSVSNTPCPNRAPPGIVRELKLALSTWTHGLHHVSWGDSVSRGPPRRRLRRRLPP